MLHCVATLSLARTTQLTDELRHIPEVLMESSAMTPLHKHKENLALDLPLPALMRRQEFFVFLFPSFLVPWALNAGEEVVAKLIICSEDEK